MLHENDAGNDVVACDEQRRPSGDVTVKYRQSIPLVKYMYDANAMPIIDQSMNQHDDSVSFRSCAFMTAQHSTTANARRVREQVGRMVAAAWHSTRSANFGDLGTLELDKLSKHFQPVAFHGRKAIQAFVRCGESSLIAVRYFISVK